MNVPFLDLRRSVRELRPELDAALARVLDSGRFVLEETVEEFERAWAAYCGAGEAVGVASGTDALAIALAALGVGEGDEVITAANTCVPTIAAIESTGARPVLVDADAASLTLDAARLDDAVTPRTRAIVPVHLYGRCADMQPILEVARARRLKVVEDAAQAHGAEYGGARAGSLADAAAFSFYPTKNLGALGDAGAVVTSDPEVATRARLLRNYGERIRYEHVLRGRNSRLDAVQAAVLLAKLPHLELWNARRRELAARYDAALAPARVEIPSEAPGQRHAYHLYVIRSRRRDEVRRSLAAAGIGTGVHYPRPVHLQPAYRDLAPAGSLPVSERLAAEVLSLPLYPQLRDEELAAVCAAVGAA